MIITCHVFIWLQVQQESACITKFLWSTIFFTYSVHVRCNGCVVLICTCIYELGCQRRLLQMKNRTKFCGILYQNKKKYALMFTIICNHYGIHLLQLEPCNSVFQVFIFIWSRILYMAWRSIPQTWWNHYFLNVNKTFLIQVCTHVPCMTNNMCVQN